MDALPSMAGREQVALEGTSVQNTPSDKVVVDRTPSLASQKVQVGRSPTDDRGYLEEQDNGAPMIVPQLDDGLIPVHNDHSTLEVVQGPPSPSASTAPSYSSSTAGSGPRRHNTTTFAPTAHYQVQTEGKAWLSAPMMRLHPEPIPIYAVSPNSSAYTTGMTPKFLSLRNARSSDNSVLVAGDSTDGPVLSSTAFAGTGQPPLVRFYSQHPSTTKSPYSVFRDLEAAVKEKSAYAAIPTYTEEGAEAQDEGAGTKSGAWSAKITGGKSLTSKGSVRFETPYGEFEWRYCEKWERKFWDAESVLALEKMVPRQANSPSPVSSVGGGAGSRTSFSLSKTGRRGKEGADGEDRVLVGYFVRNDAFRSPGTKTHTAGNGGRLLLDLREWDESEASKASLSPSQEFADAKARALGNRDSVNDLEEMEKIAITTLVCLLAREVERRRVHQAIIIA